MHALTTGIRRLVSGVFGGLRSLWRRFMMLRPRTRWIVGGLIAVAFIAFIILTSGGAAKNAAGYERTVTLATISSLSGGGASGTVLGTVRSITEAELLAQTGGTVRRVNTSVGASVGAGSVLAELENASERAAVLQAEGSYDAAVAAQSVSTTNVSTEIRNTYRTNFTEIDTALESQVDLFFGQPTATGPDLEIVSSGTDARYLSMTRADITSLMREWRANLATADSKTPEVLLRDMERYMNTITPFVVRLATVANARDSGASTAQLAALATARTTIEADAAAVAALRDDYEAESIRGNAPSASDASVKQALGSLRLAQAALEKTVIRAPIAGTVNFLPIRVGDYVTSFMHVATVAQNGALEIVAFISEDERAALSVGDKVIVEEAEAGIITSIAPALDPVTKQIEIHVAMERGGDESPLVNGQSVRISIPTTATAPTSVGFFSPSLP